MHGHTRINNECIRKKVKVTPIDEKVKKRSLKWFGHACGGPIDVPLRRVKNRVFINSNKKGKKKPKNI